MSNLCQEITLPTDPIRHIDDDAGEIALCILSAINVGSFKEISEMEELCDLVVRGLEELIDYQEYPVAAAKRSTLSRRSLGIGYIGLAHYLAKNGAKYDSQEAYDLVHKLTEAFQFYLLKASNEIAKEKGACDGFQRTKYADGILPIDTYKKEVDEIVAPEYQYDWESFLEILSTSTDCDTVHCPHRCHRRAVPLCQMPQTESNHQEITCPLRNRRRDLLSRLFRSSVP